MRISEDVLRIAEKFWDDEAFASEAALRSSIHLIQREIHRLCQNRDLDGVEKWLAVYHYAEPRCRREPLATIYEYGLKLITLSIDSTSSADMLQAFDVRPSQAQRAQLGSS